MGPYWGPKNNNNMALEIRRAVRAAIVTIFRYRLCVRAEQWALDGISIGHFELGQEDVE